MNDREKMVHAMCAAVDAGQAEAFGAWFSDKATYTFANNETLVGRDAVTAATAGAAAGRAVVSDQIDKKGEVGKKQLLRLTKNNPPPIGPHLAQPCV
ncbi:nuclear transport factor 2 family protein, partial [Nocardia abscessus]|uniref:nuclear transport factor 2 family protein n=1 Tax=Nocardia abscessus TaxID=120957 RepID=UPI002455A751